MTLETFTPGPEDINGKDEPVSPKASQGGPEKKFVIKLEEEEIPLQSESNIPKEVTQGILNEIELPEKMPKIDSMLIEDFIIDKLKDEVSTEEIVEAFFVEDMPRKILDYSEKIKQRSQEIKWEEIINKENIEEIKTEITEDMRNIEMTEDQIEKIKDVDIETLSGLGTAMSYPYEQKISVDKLQIIRRAFDYQAVFGEKFSINKITEGIFFRVLGHELGHQIDQVDSDKTRKNFSNSIPYEWEKENTDFKSENPMERFAQYWSKVAVQGQPDYQEISKNIEALRVWECDKTWRAVSDYNSLHSDNKFNLIKALSQISIRCQEGNKPEYAATGELIYARTIGFSNAPENSIPYSRETIEKAIKGV